MKARLSNYRQAPRKVRLLADLVRGKTVPEALTTLAFAAKRASRPMAKLIASAAANANIKSSLAPEQLQVKTITVNKGQVLKRSMPRARGSAFPIHKHSSHIEVELTPKVNKV
ncbi:MAG: 50S ribosomal protein L22 [Candidatus Vogelbacteria bacterium]|nr:50S ribosomal protein L22 [Candidatus Vogelbacteria bacterium]